MAEYRTITAEAAITDNIIDADGEVSQNSFNVAADSNCRAVMIDTYGIGMLNGFGVFGSPALTKRVDSGTKILNPLCIKRGAVQVGYAIASAESKLALYFVYACQQSEGVTFEKWMLYKANPTGDPYEFTFENAPNKLQQDAEHNYDLLTMKTAFSLNRDPKIVDVRLCVIVKDANGIEIDRIYSAQFRYTASLSNGTVARVKVQTANTSLNDVIEVGVIAPDAVQAKFNYSEVQDVTPMPLVSTFQDVHYEFIIPDAMFQDAQNGLELVAVMGNGMVYFGPTFEKAEESPILTAPNGTKYRLAVSNNGELSAVAVN